MPAILTDLRLAINYKFTIAAFFTAHSVGDLDSFRKRYVLNIGYSSNSYALNNCFFFLILNTPPFGKCQFVNSPDKIK